MEVRVEAMGPRRERVLDDLLAEHLGRGEREVEATATGAGSGASSSSSSVNTLSSMACLNIPRAQLYSHGSGRHCSGRTGKRIRLPMPNPAHHPSPPAAPTTPRLPSSIQLLRALPIPCYHPSALSYRSSNVAHLNHPPISFGAASRISSAAPITSGEALEVQ